MKPRLCLIFVVSCLTCALILTVSLRIGRSRVFYSLLKLQAEQSRLKHTLWQKQLKLARLVNPATISHGLSGITVLSEEPPIGIGLWEISRSGLKAPAEAVRETEPDKYVAGTQ